MVAILTSFLLSDVHPWSKAALISIGIGLFVVAIGLVVLIVLPRLLAAGQ